LFIHSGIIAIAQNDAQLAAVVAHEVAHFTKRHSAKSRISASNANSFIVFMNIMGIPLIGEIIGISSIAGFSRDHEREADLEAISRMRAHGYDISEAQKIFEFMASDALANDYDSPWFFASHPNLLERIESFESYVRNHGAEVRVNPAYQDRAVYKNIFQNVRRVALSEKLEIGHFNSLINEYENFYEASIYSVNSEELFYFANAYRLRNLNGDKELSLVLFRRYIAKHQNNSKAYMLAGVVCMDLGKLECARDNLQRAKMMSRGSNGYINMYLKKLDKKEQQNEI
jgi:predicted Zn-dependent protease